VFPSKFAFSRLVFLLPPPPSSCCIFPQSVSVLSVIDRSARPVVTLQHRNFSRSQFLFPRQVCQSVPPGLGFAVVLCSQEGRPACSMLVIFRVGSRISAPLYFSRQCLVHAVRLAQWEIPSVWDFFVRQWVLRFARFLWPPFPGRWPRLAPASRPFHLVVSLQQAHSQSPVLALVSLIFDLVLQFPIVCRLL
jgi:hypothetical protein